MEIIKENFKPITITLTSQEEVDVIFEICNASENDNALDKIADIISEDDDKVKNVLQEMYSKWKK